MALGTQFFPNLLCRRLHEILEIPRHQRRVVLEIDVCQYPCLHGFDHIEGLLAKQADERVMQPTELDLGPKVDSTF